LILIVLLPIFKEDWLVLNDWCWTGPVVLLLIFNYFFLIVIIDFINFFFILLINILDLKLLSGIIVD